VNLRVLVLFVASLALTITTFPALANEIVLEPDSPIDCGVWAYDPYRSGSLVKGKGEISCDTVKNQLKVNVELQDSAGRHFYATNTCYSAKICTTTAQGSYIAGREWMTGVSGYAGAWNAYYQTDWKPIP